MKKKVVYLLAGVLCVVLLWGCTGRNGLAGVYRTHEGEPVKIILYNDGTCQYLGNDNAAWSAKGNTVTVTVQHPDTYYLDIYLDETQTAYLYYSVVTMVQTVENVESCEFDQTQCVIRAKLCHADEDGQTQADINSINDLLPCIVRTEEYTLEGGKSKHELKVADNCLIYDLAGDDRIFIKEDDE